MWKVVLGRGWRAESLTSLKQEWWPLLISVALVAGLAQGTVALSFRTLQRWHGASSPLVWFGLALLVVDNSFTVSPHENVTGVTCGAKQPLEQVTAQELGSARAFERRQDFLEPGQQRSDVTERPPRGVTGFATQALHLQTENGVFGRKQNRAPHEVPIALT
jgi:hypothetical protein